MVHFLAKKFRKKHQKALPNKNRKKTSKVLPESTKNMLSFSSLLGISYYLTKEDFSNLISYISKIVCNGSSIIFDYPTYDRSIQTELNEKLAECADEEMKVKYSYDEITKILENNKFLIYEHLNDKEMTNNYFDIYNSLKPNNKIIAPKGVNYCLAVKQE